MLTQVKNGAEELSKAEICLIQIHALLNDNRRKYVGT